MATIDLMDQFSHLGEGGIRNNGTLDAEVMFQTSLRTMRTDFIQVKAGDSIVYKNMSGMSSIWNILSFYTGDAQGFYVSGIAGQTTPQSGVWTAAQDGYVRLFGSFPAGDNISVTMTDLAPDVEDYLSQYDPMNYRFLPNSIPKIVAHIQEYLVNHPIADSTTLQAVIDAAFRSYLEEIQETADTYISEAVPPAAAAAVDAAAAPALAEITAKTAEAAESARQAGLSQQSAEMSEENALTYRNQAQQIKDSISAEVAASVLAAQEQATLAQESAQAADESADSAEQYVAQARAQAAAADESADSAEQYVAQARAQAQTASGYASDAQGYMQDASDFADNAAQSAATFSTDPTLTISGKAADAKATGDQLSALKSAIGYGFLNTTDYTGDANDLTPGVSRVTASATHIPVAQVGYVVTFARTASTAKSQIYINAPIGTYTGRCHLYARYLTGGTWSSWEDFATTSETTAEAILTNGSDFSGDLNNATGVSRVLATATNTPVNEMGYVLTIVRSASAKAQIYITSNALYFRTCASGTWTTWKSTMKSTDRAVGYTFGDSLMAQDGKAFAYPNPQYNSDEIGETCIGWQTLLAREFGVSMTNFAVGGQGIAGQKPVIKSKTYNGIDFVIISVGVNDYSNAVQLGQLPTSRNATFTDGLFIDDLCDSIEYILKQNPEIKILLFTPCQRDTTWRNDGVPDFSKSATDIYTQNSRGLYLKDYADAIKEIGRMYSCVVCDMYAESGLNYLTLPEFTFEGVHPTNVGYLFTSRALFEAFKKI